MSDSLDPIARPSGALAMVAMDQRESLRTMFRDAGGSHVPDSVLIDFKAAVAAELGSLASGFLADREFGLPTVRAALPKSTGLIVAADALTQEPGGPVEETALDEAVLAPDFDLQGAVALKLLVIWRRDELREARIALADRFIRESAARGLVSVLEPVVRATPEEAAGRGWDLDVAIREAAAELSPLRPGLYKAQVPIGGAGDPAEQLAASEALGAAIEGPWVVLSQGVPRDRFLPAVEAACRGGASGFLAGRALWSDVVGVDDVPSALRRLAVPRLERLVEVVDREARPWSAR